MTEGRRAAPQARAAVALTLLTGFLGVGKTTLLNAALRDPALAGTAVVVNEFGDIGVDHLLIEAVEGDMLVLTTGCVCCAARGDVLAAVERLMARRDAGELAFDRIVIETTGLADPGPILNALLLGPVLTGAVRIDSVLTLVSAPHGAATLDRYAEARRQVALADRILLTKRDLLASCAAEPHAAELESRLRRLNPSVEIVSRHGTGAALLQSRSGAAFVGASVPLAPFRHHAADAAIQAVALEAGPLDAARLARFIDLVQERYGPALLRLKGVAALAHDPLRPVVIQAIGHMLYPAERLEARRGDLPCTRLVAILDGADPAGVTRLWGDLFGPPDIDRPDAAALMSQHEEGPGLFG